MVQKLSKCNIYLHQKEINCALNISKEIFFKIHICWGFSYSIETSLDEIQDHLTKSFLHTENIIYDRCQHVDRHHKKAYWRNH